MFRARHSLSLAWLAGLLGPVIFGLTVAASGVLRTGYDHASQAISELGEDGAATQPLMAFGFLAMAVGTAAFVSAARRHPTLSVATVPLLVVSVGMAGSAFLPCTPGCPPPDGVSVPWFGQDTLHLAFGIPIFLAASIAPLLAAWRAWREPRLRVYRGYSLASGCLGLAMFAAFGPMSQLDLFGLAQRVLVAAGFGWIGVTALLHYQEAWPAPTPPLVDRSEERCAET